MTLRALGVANFKCFTDVNLSLGPLSLLTGYNSAGKSTVLQSIFLMSQALRLGLASRHLPLNGQLTRLGSVGDVVSNRSAGREIQVSITDDKCTVTWRCEANAPSARSLTVAEVELIEDGRLVDSWAQSFWISKHEIPDLVIDLQGVVCLSAVRGGSAETYPTPDDISLSNAEVGTEGQFAPWWYSQFADAVIEEARRHPEDREGRTLRRQLDAYMNDLFPGSEANADELAGTSVVRLGLRTGTTSDWHRPANVGYGLGYVFPILVALLLADRDQVIVVDSPEAHLHPSAQSKMGRMLARFAAAGVQVVVETHSDHLLNGVRLGVKDGLIEPESTKVHFFSGVSEDGDHGIVSPQLGKDGSLDSWPSGFFDQAERDLSNLAGWDDQS